MSVETTPFVPLSTQEIIKAANETPEVLTAGELFVAIGAAAMTDNIEKVSQLVDVCAEQGEAAEELGDQAQVDDYAATYVLSTLELQQAELV